MASRVVIEGAEEFREALRNLPTEMRDEAAGIVRAAAQQAKSEIVSQYPTVTGNLKGNVRLTEELSAHGTTAIVKSSAKHANIYEYGTAVRHTRLGYKRGMMPPANVFVPTVIRHRRTMTERLVDLVKRAGFVVTGDGG